MIPVSGPAQWSSGIVSALGLVGCGFDPGLCHTRDCKNVFGTPYLGVGIGGLDHPTIPGRGTAAAHRSLRGYLG